MPHQPSPAVLTFRVVERKGMKRLLLNRYLYCAVSARAFDPAYGNAQPLLVFKEGGDWSGERWFFKWDVPGQNTLVYRSVWNTDRYEDQPQGPALRAEWFEVGDQLLIIGDFALQSAVAQMPTFKTD